LSANILSRSSIASFLNLNATKFRLKIKEDLYRFFSSLIVSSMKWHSLTVLALCFTSSNSSKEIMRNSIIMLDLFLILPISTVNLLRLSLIFHGNFQRDISPLWIYREIKQVFSLILRFTVLIQSLSVMEILDMKEFLDFSLLMNVTITADNCN